MKYPKLIILYGRFQKEANWKQQRMIDGGCTCMYREFAERFGEIIYLAPQKVSKPWEKSITQKKKLVKYLNTQPDAIIWSVKHDTVKDSVLAVIEHKKVYYSCCANNMYNKYCDISLVDQPVRVEKNAVLWVKGKDPAKWYPKKKKIYDFLVIGPRGDKNELFFLKQMEKTVDEYSILWIGGKAFEGRIHSKHEVSFTHFLDQKTMRKLIPYSKIGVILSEHPAEGFPQVFLEMTMCGLPVIKLIKGFENKAYRYNSISIVDKNEISNVAEEIYKKWNYKYAYLYRNFAVDNYSLEASYDTILAGFKEKTSLYADVFK